MIIYRVLTLTRFCESFDRQYISDKFDRLIESYRFDNEYADIWGIGVAESLISI
jgi:hypothetical protein